MGRQGVSGVYRNDDGYTYAGDVDVGRGAANGHGVHKWSDGTTWYGEWSAGKRHGHSVSHWDTGDVGHWLWEHGRWLHKALVLDDTRCKYDDRECSADHPQFAALKAAAGLVEVRPGGTVPAVQHPNATPRQPSAMRAGSFCTRRGLQMPPPPRPGRESRGPRKERSSAGYEAGASPPMECVTLGHHAHFASPASRRETFWGEVRSIAVLCTCCRCMLVSVSVVVCLRRG